MDQELLNLLLAGKKYIEEREVQIDGEWGRERSLQQMIAEGYMPEIYNLINRYIEINSPPT